MRVSGSTVNSSTVVEHNSVEELLPVTALYLYPPRDSPNFFSEVLSSDPISFEVSQDLFSDVSLSQVLQLVFANSDVVYHVLVQKFDTTPRS